MTTTLFLMLTREADGTTNGDLRSGMQDYGKGPLFHAQTDGIMFLDRMQVGIFSVPDIRCLTLHSDSRKVGPQ